MTLLELLVVLAIMGLLAALAAPVMSGANDRMALRTLAEQLAGELSVMRAKALGRGEDVSIAPHDSEVALETSGEALPFAPPEGISATWVPGPHARTPEVVFYADGSAADGAMLLRKGDAEVRLRIHWLTGAVHVE